MNRTSLVLVALVLGLAGCGSQDGSAPGVSPSPSGEPTLPQSSAVTLVDAYPALERLDVYADGELLTGSDGIAPGGTQGATISSGTPIITIFEHSADPPGEMADREDSLLQEHEVSVPGDVPVDLAIGYSPAGGVGLPYVSVFPDDLAAEPGRFLVAVRHVADAPTVRVTLRPAGPQEPTVADVQRGEQVVLPAPGSDPAALPVGDYEWSLFAQNAPWYDDALGQDIWNAGDVVVIYAGGAASVETGDGGHTASTFTSYQRLLE